MEELKRITDVRHLNTDRHDLYTGVIRLRDMDVDLTYDKDRDNLIIQQGLLLTHAEIKAISKFAKDFFRRITATA